LQALDELKLVYIAGPFRAATPWLVEENVRRAERLALDVWKEGAVAMCPHTMNRNFDKALPDAAFLNGALALLARCDALITVPGWESSRGTQAEVRFAQERCMPVFNSLAELGIWLVKLRQN
jgi:hypothetical protein